MRFGSSTDWNTSLGLEVADNEVPILAINYTDHHDSDGEATSDPSLVESVSSSRKGNTTVTALADL
jgi:hypothetical protein